MTGSDLVNRDAEEALLGSCLHADLDESAVAALDTSVFTSTARANLFSSLLAMRGDGVDTSDLTIVADSLRRRGMLDQIRGDSADGALELARLVSRVPSGANAAAHARIVADLSARRRLHDEARRVQMEAADLTTPLARIRLDLPSPPLSAEGGFLGVDELLSDQAAQVRYLVHGLIPASATTLLVAHPKAGKSTLVFSWLRALERGEPWCDLQCEKTSAVVLSEEGRPSLAQKVRRFGLRYVRLRTRSDLTRAGDFPSLIAEAAAEARRVGAGILVVDPLAAWMRLRPEAEKDAGAMQAAMQPLLAAAAGGLTVVAVHHSRKARGDEGTAVRGSSATFASADVLLELRRSNPKVTTSTARELVVTSRFEGAPPSLSIDLVGDRYVSLATAAEARVAEIGRRILEELHRATAGELTRDELLARVGHKKARVLAALNALVQSGEVIPRGGGVRGDPSSYALAGGTGNDSTKSPDQPDFVPRSPPSGGGTGGPDSSGDSGPGCGNGVDRRPESSSVGRLAARSTTTHRRHLTSPANGTVGPVAPERPNA